VLLGTVISVKDLEIVPIDVLTHFQLYVRRVEIIVDRTFKGRSVSDTVIVYTAVEGTECGFDFHEGLSYIVYGDRDSSFDGRQVSSDEPLYGRGIYWTSTCTRTRAYDEEEVKDIDAL
jgi:hypothetical protein